MKVRNMKATCKLSNGCSFFSLELIDKYFFITVLVQKYSCSTHEKNRDRGCICENGRRIIKNGYNGVIA